MSCGAKMVAKEREDMLAYLPRQAVTKFRRGQLIYNEEHPSIGLYLVLSGRVKVSVVSEAGHHIVTGIFGDEEFFGECALLNSDSKQTATALEDTTVMAWSPDAVEEQIERHPRLGIALVQMLVQRCVEFADRLKSMAYDKTSQRLALSLIQLAMRLGTTDGDGSTRIPPFTHELLSEYVGTSRSIVTTHMNLLRDEGRLRYCRKYIHFNRTLAEHLRGKKR
jgi:CRP/FNR family transcriptional regulator, cyclic AMP receptor protein